MPIFEALWTSSEVLTLATTTVHVASIAHLIALKRLAGRPQDQSDIEALEAIAAAKAGPHG